MNNLVIKYFSSKLRNFASCASKFPSNQFSYYSSVFAGVGRAYLLDFWQPTRGLLKGTNTLGTRRRDEQTHAFWTQQEYGYFVNLYFQGKEQAENQNLKSRKLAGERVLESVRVIYRIGRREQPAVPTPIAATRATSSSPLSRSEPPRTRGKKAPQCSFRPPPTPTDRKVSCWMALIQCRHRLHYDCVRRGCLYKVEEVEA